MRRQLNTLYVTTDGARLRKDGENIVMQVEGQEQGRLPMHMLESIVCFGRVLVSPPLMGHCSEQGITITHLTQNGRFLARIEGPVAGNVLLRRSSIAVPMIRQPAPRLCAVSSPARSRISGRSGRGRRDRADRLDAEALGKLDDVIRRLARVARDISRESDVERMRGLEGEAAHAYFDTFDALIGAAGDTFTFRGRNRRPPTDPINALLSFLYTLLTHDCRSAAETVGLDPAVGFLHRDRPGRPGLALDLAEEFRPMLAERLALTLVNRGQLKARDFEWADSGAVTLTDDGRKTVLTAYQERKREELHHAFTDEKAPIGMLPSLQAQLLARHLRGDLDGYPPFLWK